MTDPYPGPIPPLEPVVTHFDEHTLYVDVGDYRIEIHRDSADLDIQAWVREDIVAWMNLDPGDPTELPKPVATLTLPSPWDNAEIWNPPMSHEEYLDWLRTGEIHDDGYWKFRQEHGGHRRPLDWRVLEVALPW